LSDSPQERRSGVRSALVLGFTHIPSRKEPTMTTAWEQLSAHPDPVLRFAARQGDEALPWPTRYRVLAREAPRGEWLRALRQEAADTAPEARLRAMQTGRDVQAAALALKTAALAEIMELSDIIGQGLVLIHDAQAAHIAAPWGFRHADSQRVEYRPAALAAAGWQPGPDFAVTALARTPKGPTLAVLCEAEGKPDDADARADQLRASLRRSGVAGYDVAIPPDAHLSCHRPGDSLALIVLPAGAALSCRAATSIR
jgi:hypothetical protein